MMMVMVVAMEIQFGFEEQELCQEDTHWLYSFLSPSDDDDDDDGDDDDDDEDDDGIGINLIWLWAPSNISGRHKLYGCSSDDMYTSFW